MFYEKTLSDNLIGASGIDDLIDAFEMMCRERSGLFDDLVFLESGNFDFSGKKEFYVSLARQYKDSAFTDGFSIIRLDIIYPEIKLSFKNKRSLKKYISSDQTGGSYSLFFKKVRESALLRYIKEQNLQYDRYEILQEETN
ncbi:MAG: hypothetical protein IJJ41_00485 [Clostridia bacterium]|nr:hypothetical protein [Clostridia bacterium]